MHMKIEVAKERNPCLYIKLKVLCIFTIHTVHAYLHTRLKDCFKRRKTLITHQEHMYVHVPAHTRTHTASDVDVKLRPLPPPSCIRVVPWGHIHD